MDLHADPAARTPVIMKFGGSSVAEPERLRRVAAFVVERARAQPVVVVVSAMGKTTDRLVAEARALCDSPSPRELDMLLSTGERTSMALLALAIQGQGGRAISLTGSQCGILTDHRHGRARVMEVRPFRILDELAAGQIVIVGGFQGVSYKREVTTLGRGGSDTTAVALAAALGGDCEIYSDVDGVYSADPRHVSSAQRLDCVDYDEMRALSRAGARVLHARAVELAEEQGVAIYARATPGAGGDSPGQTVVRRRADRPSGVRAVTCDPAVVELEIELPAPASDERPAARLARALGPLGLHYLSICGRRATALLSTTQRDDAARVLDRAAAAAAELSATADLRRTGLALVSCVGTGLEERPEIVHAAIESLEKAAVEVLGVHTDANTMAVLVPAPAGTAATQALHALFVGDLISPG
jgi:aspartate kinase